MTRLLSAAWFGAAVLYGDQQNVVMLPLLQAIEDNQEGCEIEIMQRRYRITEDCKFQESNDNGGTWNTLRDLATLECLNGDDGRTPTLRGRRNGSQTTIEWKYTDEPDSAYRAVGVIDDGDDGRTPQMRGVKSGNVLNVQWKYTDEPDTAYRSAGSVQDGVPVEIRGLRDDNSVQLQWKYQDEPVSSFRSAGEVFDGREVELRTVRQSNEVRIQWKYTEEPVTAWRTIGTVEDGEDGASAPAAEMRLLGCFIQFRSRPTDGWTTLYNLAEDPCNQEDQVFPEPGGVTLSNKCSASVYLMSYLERTLQDILNAKDAGLSPGENAADVWERVIRPRLKTGLRRTPIINYVVTLFDGSTDVDQVQASLTLSRREQLQCLLYCTAGPSFTSSMFNNLKAAADNLNYGEANSGNEFAQLMDAVGFSDIQDRWNIGLLGSNVVDCAGCECSWCFGFNFVQGNGSFSVVPQFNLGQYVASVGWRTTATGSSQSAVISRLMSNSTTITSLSITVEVSGTATANVSVSSNNLSIINALNVRSGTYTFNGVLAAGTSLIVNPSSGPSQGSGVVTVTSITVNGIGTNPFGSDNC